MAESNIIKEFLVALGFKTDEAALKKFDQGITEATRKVVGLAAGVEAMAIAVGIGVSRMASNLESLYFATVKAKDGATNLKAFDRAAQNFGAQVGEGLNSVQSLARFLRNNPGGEGYLASLGVQARDAKGELRGTTDMMLDLARKFSSMPYYLANQYAGIFGISEDVLRAMLNGDFAKEVERQRKLMKDIGLQQTAKDAHDFMVKLRDLLTFVQAFGIQVYDALVRKLGSGVENLTEWLRTKGPVVADRVAEILVKLIQLAEMLAPAIAWLVSKFIEWDKATGGWSTRLLGLLVVLKMFGGASVIGGVLSLAGALLKLGGGMVSAASSGTGLLALLGRLGLVGAAAGAGWLIGKGINTLLPQDWKDQIGKMVSIAAGALGSKEAREAIAVNDPLTYFRMSGWSKEQAAGIVANLQAESGMNPRAVGDKGKAYGVAQWHPERQAAFAKWAGHDIRESTTAEQLDFVNHELKQGAERKAGALLAAARTAQQSGEIMSRYYERPANAEREAQRRGQAAVHIAQENNYHIRSTDPVAAGREVQSVQGRTNAELTRNFQVAVQ